MKRILLLATLLMGLSLPFVSCTKETTTIKQGAELALGYDSRELNLDTNADQIKVDLEAKSFISEIKDVINSALIQANNGSYNRNDFINNAQTVVNKYDNGYIYGKFYLTENEQNIKEFTMKLKDR